MANTQLQDNQMVPYAVFESNAKGKIDPPGAGDTVVVTSSDGTLLTVLPDAVVDPAKVPNNSDGTPGDATKCMQTGFLVGNNNNKAGVGVGATATFSHADGTPGPTPVTDLLDVVIDKPSTGIIALGQPVPQATE